MVHPSAKWEPRPAQGEWGSVRGDQGWEVSGSGDRLCLHWDLTPSTVLPYFPRWNPHVALNRGQAHCKLKIKQLTCSEVFLFLMLPIFFFLSCHCSWCGFYVPQSLSVCRNYLYPCSIKVVPLKELPKYSNTVLAMYLGAKCLYLVQNRNRTCLYVRHWYFFFLFFVTLWSEKTYWKAGDHWDSIMIHILLSMYVFMQFVVYNQNKLLYFIQEEYKPCSSVTPTHQKRLVFWGFKGIRGWCV